MYDAAVRIKQALKIQNTNTIGAAKLPLLPLSDLLALA